MEKEEREEEEEEDEGKTLATVGDVHYREALSDVIRAAPRDPLHSPLL